MGLERQSDSELLVSSVEDADAFLVVFERHFDRIAGYVGRRAGVAHSEELVSEVFARAFAHRRRYDPTKADVLAWLYGIATNVLREHFRESRRELALADKMQAYTGGATTADADDGSPRVPLIVEAVRGLSAKDREPLFLYALADLDYQQIANALNVPVGTVRSRINRARGHLRRQLKEAWPIPRRLSKGANQ